MATPRLTNLISDPQEREPIPLPYLHTWTATHLNKLIAQFQASAQREPLVPIGAPSIGPDFAHLTKALRHPSVTTAPNPANKA